jgi:hypothetical protein
MLRDEFDGITDRLSVRLDAFSIFGPIEAIRILVELGQDCGGRTPDSSSPIRSTVNAPWEPYSNVPRDYIIPVPLGCTLSTLAGSHAAVVMTSFVRCCAL